MNNIITDYTDLDTFIESHIYNRKINIDVNDFTYAMEKYGVEPFREALTEHIFGKIDFPLYKKDKEILESDYYALKKYKSSFSLGKKIISKFSYKHYDVEKQKLFISNSHIFGMKCSDNFLNEQRMKVGTNHFKSPVEVWNNRGCVKTLLKSLFTLKYFCINEKILFKCIQMKHYICSQFNTCIAKQIYDLFKAEQIIDMSMGWGDRLCGFMASKYGKYYLGVDPNVGNHDCYKKEYEFLKEMSDADKKVKFIIDGAEYVDYEKYGEFDLAFTSPPYFSKEHYSDDEKQSFKNHETVDSWKNDFLFEMIKRVKKAVKKDGYIILNISDVNIDYKRKYFCDEMVDFAESIGLCFVGCFGMQLSHRVNIFENITVDSDTTYVEPCFVFKNGDFCNDKTSVDYCIRNGVLPETNKNKLF